MKASSEKGVVGTDITVAIMVVMIFMSILGVLYFNITKVAKGIERGSEATYIATEIIEAIKSKVYTDVQVTNGNKEITKNGTQYQYLGTSSQVNIGTSLPISAGYTCYINIQNFVPSQYESNTSEDKDLVKIVNVQVQYKLANQVQTVELKTIILK